MSFIDLMSNTIWSEADIVRRTEEIIHGQFSREAENIINRKVTGAMLKVYTPTAEEQAELIHYAEVCEQARLAGVQARADMALLYQIMDTERHLARLAQPVVDPVVDELGDVVNQAEVDVDVAERAQAQSAVDAASPEVMQWVEVRNPPPPAPPVDEFALAVLALSTAHTRLQQPLVEPILDELGVVTNQPALDTDAAERAAAQLVIDNAAPAVVAAYELGLVPPTELIAPVNTGTAETTVTNTVIEGEPL